MLKADRPPKDLSLAHILLFVAVSWRKNFLDGDSYHRAFYCAACPADPNQGCFLGNQYCAACPADPNQGCFLGNQYCAAPRLVANGTEQKWRFMVCRGWNQETFPEILCGQETRSWTLTQPWVYYTTKVLLKGWREKEVPRGWVSKFI